jgi:hypothetical protein
MKLLKSHSLTPWHRWVLIGIGVVAVLLLLVGKPLAAAWGF